MKRNIKKLAVFVIIPAIAMFIPVVMASADGHHWKNAIQGQYAFTGEVTCLFAPLGFDSTLTPINGVGFVQTYSRQGVFTFRYDGTGSGHLNPSGVVAHSFQFQIPNNPPTFVPPNAGTQDITFDFTYTLEKNRRITIKAVPGTFISTQLTGPNAGYVFKIEGTSTDGVIALDGKIISLYAGAPDVYTVTRIDIPNPPPPNPVYSICHEAAVLIWVSDNADHDCDRD